MTSGRLIANISTGEERLGTISNSACAKAHVLNLDSLEIGAFLDAQIDGSYHTIFREILS